MEAGLHFTFVAVSSSSSSPSSPSMMMIVAFQSNRIQGMKHGVVVAALNEPKENAAIIGRRPSNPRRASGLSIAPTPRPITARYAARLKSEELRN